MNGLRTMNDTNTLKQLLTPYDVGHTKVHIGPEEDGGYVISYDCLEKTDAVYSLGVGEVCGFDVELANKGYKVYQYEAAHAKPFVDHENFVYNQMFMTGDNFSQELISNGHEGKTLMLSMDIEGGEYDLIIKTPIEVLDQFNQIAFEIHDVLFNPNVETILRKLEERFVLTHIHANNNCIRFGAYSSGMKDDVPNVLELTYINRRDITVEPTVSKRKCPDPNLDFKNQFDLPEVELKWWLS
jgi:hypothetical protein